MSTLSSGQQPKKGHYLSRRLMAFCYAFSGLRQSLRVEPHMWIHLVSAILVVAASIYFGISGTEWAIVSVLIAVVMMAELFNSAIEKICDLVQPEQDPVVKYVKDISSAAVLLVCIAALVCGLIIFLPYLRSSLGF